MGLAQFIVSLSTESSTRNIVALEGFAAISVDFNTDFEDLNLPATAEAAFNHGPNEEVSIVWEVGAYDQVTVDTYTLFAEPVLTDNMSNTSNKKATILVTVEAIPIPDWSLAANYALIVFPPGLVINTTNAYGVVDSAGKITSLKSIAPGPTGRDFATNGVSPDLIHEVCQFNGDGRLRDPTTATWNFMSFNAVAANLKWTLHAVILIEDVPGQGGYGILGNCGASSGNIGIDIFIQNTAAAPNCVGSHIARDSAPFVLQGTENNSYPSREWVLLTIVTDISQSAANRQKLYINGNQVTYTVTSTSTAVVTGPTFNMDLGTVGNAVAGMVGRLAMLTIQSVAEVNTNFINSILPQIRRQLPDGYIVDRTRTYAETTFLDDADYYLGITLSKNPITGVWLAVFGHWSSAGHTWSETNKVSFKKSTNNLLSWGSTGTVYDPPSTRGAMDSGFFFDPTGVGHGFTNVPDGTGVTSDPDTYQLWYFTTNDDGDTWTPTQVTPPSDGMSQMQGYGNGYTVNGWNYYPINKAKPDASESAVYVLRWAVGANISTAEWRELYHDTPFINETTIAHLGGNEHVAISRTEAGLYTQFYTNDNWLTTTNQGALNFGGDSSALKGPARLAPFEIDGVPCLAVYYPLKSTPNLKVAYTKCSDVVGSGVACWVNKTVIVTGSAQRHYGMVVHFNNNFNGYGIYTRETNLIISFHTPSGHYLATKTALGL